MAAVVILFGIVWAAVTVAVDSGGDICPSEVTGSGEHEERCRWGAALACLVGVSALPAPRDLSAGDRANCRPAAERRRGNRLLSRSKLPVPTGDLTHDPELALPIG
jgi:hypothetical protein